MATVDEIAWAAGLFEGEGTIYITPHQSPQPRLALATTDLDVLQRFTAIIEGGKIYDHAPRKLPGYKTQWRWQAHTAFDCERILMLFYPYLGERRKARADEALNVIARRDFAKERRGRGVKSLGE